MKRLLCQIIGHRYYVIKEFGHGMRKVGCKRCGKCWGMHDDTRSFIKWDRDLEELTRVLGHE